MWRQGAEKERLLPLSRAQGSKATLELGGIKMVATRCLWMPSGIWNLGEGSWGRAHLLH